MAKWTISLGVLLILVGLGGYAISNSDTPGTALIPAGIGVLFLVFGGLLFIDNKLVRIIVAHLAVLAALVLPASIIYRWFTAGMGTPLAMLSQVLTIVLMWGFVGLGFRSFLLARRKRKQAPVAA